jgi:predicted DNA-binding transcriptional regulator AlpA
MSNHELGLEQEIHGGVFVYGLTGDRRQLAPWLTREEVLALTRWSSGTLLKRIRDGSFPRPVMRGRWVCSEVEHALSGAAGTSEQAREEWGADKDGIDKARSANIRRRTRSS